MDSQKELHPIFWYDLNSKVCISHPCHKRLHNVNLNSAYLKLRPGLNLNLRTYQPRQRVCHSGCWWILCMTPKRKSWGVLFRHLFMKGFDLWMFLCFMPCQTKTQKTWSWYLGLVFFFEKWWTHDPHLFNGDIVAVFETRVDSQLESSILWAQGLDPLHLRV